MASTKEDLQAIAELMDTRLDAQLTSALSPIHQQLNNMDKRLDKENTTVTREVVNTLVEWTETESRALTIRYPLRKAE